MTSKGYKHTQEAKERIRQSKLDINNPNYKGDKVGHDALHYWVKYRLLKPKLCQKCNERPAQDLANISGKYLRDLKDWEYLCRICHMISDGRMNNFKLVAGRYDRHCFDAGKTKNSDSS